MTVGARILIATADTGGGHRAMAAAIAAALRESDPHTEILIQDVFRVPPPSLFEWMTRLYGPCIRYAPRLYGWIYHLGNRRAGFGALDRSQQPLERKLADLLARTRPDVVVNTHPLANRPLLHAAEATGRHTPVFASVSELVTVHRSWFDARLALLNTATPESFSYVRRWGAPDERVRCVGLPVDSRFTQVKDSPEALRASFGLDPARPTALLVGGGEGAGGLEAIVREVERERLPVQLLVVCGKNQALKSRLEAANLRVSARIFGFVNTMPDLMRASDFIVTKGGPQTIAEALVVGRPIVVTQTLPGQEEGNGEFVESRGVGFGPSTTPELVHRIGELATDDGLRAWMSRNARRHGRPAAARHVADMVLRLAGAA